MYRKLVLFGLMWLIFGACNPGPKQGISTKLLADLHKQLMDLHDSTMVGHGVSLQLIDQLDQKKLVQADSTSTVLDSIRTVLDHTNEAMMDWMAGYTDPVTQDSTALIYLQDQLRLMKEIAANQTNSIHRAKMILEANQ